MQTSEYRHCDKREKHALIIVTRASKKRSLATLKATIAKTHKKSEILPVLMQEHADACADLKRK